MQNAYVCKRGAPFSTAEEDFVQENRKWGPKRLYGMMNSWNPAISVNIRCNNDCKILTNGGDTKNLTWYVTSYASKKQGKSHNMSALMAKGHAYHTEWMTYLDSLEDAQRKMLFCVLQMVNHQQEISAAMVTSYLMGWGDVYHSHHYTPLFWSSIARELLCQFPELKRQW